MVIVTKITIYFIVFILIGYSLLRFYHLWNRRGLPDWLYWMFQAVMLGTFFICQNKSVWIPDSMFKNGLLIFSAITFNVYLYTPVFCFIRGCIRWIHKKVEAKRGHRINRFFSFVNHPAKPIYLFIILSLILGIFSYANAVHMVTTEYAVSVPETNKKTEKMVIAFITDCHLGSAIDQNQWIKLVDKINDMQPDLLILGGDIVDNNTPDSYYTLLTDTLGRLQPAFGKFCVEGDNEAEQTDDYAEQMEKAGVTFLKDQTAYLYNQYRLIGLRDMSDKDKILPSSYLEQIKKDSPYTIVISHRPRKLEDIAQYNVNLTLCGHTAGGQYPVTGWIENLSSDMIYGIKKTGTMTVVTTSGVGQYGIPSKIVAPAEIVKITLS